MTQGRTIIEALLATAERNPDRGYTFVGEKSETFIPFSELA